MKGLLNELLLSFFNHHITLPAVIKLNKTLWYGFNPSLLSIKITSTTTVVNTN
jgi:hypothetical protein